MGEEPKGRHLADYLLRCCTMMGASIGSGGDGGGGEVLYFKTGPLLPGGRLRESPSPD